MFLKGITAEYLVKVTTAFLLAYSLIVFVAYVSSLMVLSYLKMYRGNFSLAFNLVMFILFYSSLGIHLTPGLNWFGKKKKKDRHFNLVMCRTLSLLGALLTAFLGSAYFHFDLVKNYWPIIFPSES